MHLAQDNQAGCTSPQRILTRKLEGKNEMKTTSTQHLNLNFVPGPIEEKKTEKLINCWEDKNHSKTPPQMQASIRTKNAGKILTNHSKPFKNTTPENPVTKFNSNRDWTAMKTSGKTSQLQEPTD